MKILFLGTGAADYNESHRDMAGYRRNSSVLIDGVLLIDPGPCVPEALARFGADVGNIRYVLNTHRHRDHYNENTMQFLRDHGAVPVEIRDGETVAVGAYRVSALRGNHSTQVHHFIVDDSESRLFYGLDSAWLLYEEIRAMQENNVDLAVLDGTVGFVKGDYRVFEHCNMDMIVTISETLSRYAKRICISHMARTLHTDHETLTRDMAKYGVEVAFDGWEMEI